MAYTAQHQTTRRFHRMLDFDPNATSETAVTLNPADSEAYLALSDNGAPKRYLFGVMRSVGSDGITSVTVKAATAADGSGETAVKAITPTTADAVGDTVWVEVDADQIRAALPAATHVGLEIALETATDECVVVVIGDQCQFEYDGLTADYIS